MPLPLETTPSLTRADFIVSEGNRDALAFIESWPAWTVSVAGLYGPPGCGKSHLAEIWVARSGAQRTQAAALSGSAFALLDRSYPIVIEDVDASVPNPARDAAIFDLLEAATHAVPVLLTGRVAPADWRAALPDLASRFSAMVAFSIWGPDENLLRNLAHKLLGDRQLTVPDSTINQMLRMGERSPGALRDLIARADAKALAEGRPITSALVRELLETDSGPS